MIYTMKKLFIYIIAGLTLTAGSCKKFLEQPPDNRAELNTPEQVSQLLGTAYPQGNYMAFAESASDNVADKGTGDMDLTVSDPYHFRDVREDEQDSPENYWYACYAAIAVANLALETIDKAANQQAYAAQKGEALVARAYAHFMLVNFFAETYDPATAASEPGIPYVTTPEKVVIRQYERKTVAYVYEMIEKDLLAGLPLIDDTKYKIPSYHFTRVATHAFAARFYLFKRDYTKTVEYANQVFAAGNVVNLLRPWNTVYKTKTYQEMWALYAKATEPANLLLVETVSWWGRNYVPNRYGLTSAKRDQILGNNVTGGPWAFRNHVYTQGVLNYMLPKVNEHFVRSSVNANIGTGYVVVPLFTAEEVLFNRAEAYVYLNNTAAALADLNAYASTRIDDYDAAAHTITANRARLFYGINDPQTAILRTILDFKRAEYVQEGMRWFDILRYRIPVTHTFTDEAPQVLAGDDPRRLFQIPQAASQSGVEPNPR